MRKWFCMNTTINNIHIFKTQEAATVLTILYRVQEIWQYSTNYRSSRPDMFYKKRVLRNFVEFTGKYLRQSLFFNKVAIATLLKKRLWRRCFPVNFTKFLRIPFFYRTPLVAASEITRIKSVSSVSRSSTLWRLNPVTEFFFGIFRKYPEQSFSKKPTDFVYLKQTFYNRLLPKIF